MDIPLIESFNAAAETLETMNEKEHEELLDWINQVHQNFELEENTFGQTVVAEYSVPVNLGALCFAAGFNYAANLDPDEQVIEVPMTREAIVGYIAYLTERGSDD